MDQLQGNQILPDKDLERYSRQLLVKEVGGEGQKRLSKCRVVVVGAGGLGCPVAMYLATAGVGTIGIVEFDSVEISNLHRQVGHCESSVGSSKAASLSRTLKSLNSSVECIPYEQMLSTNNAMEIIKSFDIVVDASDNVSTRYLLNDTCVLLNKPLVSGSALRWEGQLTVYNFLGGPCYRCVFPKPPPPECVTNCSDGGVIGPVTGVIGSLQALEVIKIATLNDKDVCSGRLVLFDGLNSSFRSVRLRPKDMDCSVCGGHPTINQLIDYNEFCKAAPCDKTPSLRLIEDKERISCEDLKQKLINGCPPTLVDVRPREEFDLCSIKGSVNMPFDSFVPEKVDAHMVSGDGDKELVVICRRGNDSQKAVLTLREAGLNAKDLIGGLAAWAKTPDVTFPNY